MVSSPRCVLLQPGSSLGPTWPHLALPVRQPRCHWGPSGTHWEKGWRWAPAGLASFPILWRFSSLSWVPPLASTQGEVSEIAIESGASEVGGPSASGPKASGPAASGPRCGPLATEDSTVAPKGEGPKTA